MELSICWCVVLLGFIKKPTQLQTTQTNVGTDIEVHAKCQCTADIKNDDCLRQFRRKKKNNNSSNINLNFMMTM